MSRNPPRFGAWLPLAVLVVAPTTACDLLKKDSPDAAVVVAPAATTAAPVAEPAAVAPVAPGVAPVAPPLGAATPTPVKPIGAVDGGKPAVVADAGPAAADAGNAAPAPTPTFTIPTAIPGFDASAFKPPPGFPTALPTFPPPAPSK